VQQYLALWSEFKAAGAVPPQPAVDPAEVITENSTIADVLAKMARLAKERLAEGTIDTMTVSGLAGRKVWVIAGKDTPTCVNAETMEEVEHMAAIRFEL
jgi:hypothetical protein